MSPSDRPRKERKDPLSMNRQGISSANQFAEVSCEHKKCSIEIDPIMRDSVLALIRLMSSHPNARIMFQVDVENGNPFGWQTGIINDPEFNTYHDGVLSPASSASSSSASSSSALSSSASSSSASSSSVSSSSASSSFASSSSAVSSSSASSSSASSSSASSSSASSSSALARCVHCQADSGMPTVEASLTGSIYQNYCDHCYSDACASGKQPKCIIPCCANRVDLMLSRRDETYERFCTDCIHLNQDNLTYERRMVYIIYMREHCRWCLRKELGQRCDSYGVYKVVCLYKYCGATL